ncbi:hypothetical protein [Klebsiella quasipneumoniae]|uniref:hypothetical protein n=1 Tax=Klebsiella quasipneumoniae TaxID=1463165 RepID=UPI001D103630|nr:hypothetical protein [Klebsiella quasipneumoniae]
MALPSFDNGWREGQSVKPRILVLEIKDKDRPDDKALGWVLVEREETYRRDPRMGRSTRRPFGFPTSASQPSFRTGMVEKGGLMAATRATSTLCR